MDSVPARLAEGEAMSWRSLLRDSAVIILGIFLIFFLFSVQTFLEQMRETLSSPQITGEAIIINTTGDDGLIHIIPSSPPEPPPSPPEPPLNPELACWMEGGLTPDDIVIGKDFFEGLACPEERKKDRVTAAVEDRCLTVAVGNAVHTNICAVDEGLLSFGLVLPPTAAAVAPPLTPERTYTGLMLFLAFLITMMIVWREYEVRERIREHLEHERESHHLPLPPEQIERRVIKAAPLFKEILSEEEKLLSSEDVQEIHEKLMQEQKMMITGAPLTHEEIGAYIRTFNALGKEISEELRHGNLSKARKKYLLLFPLYTRLYYAVDESRKRDLVDVIKYLHDQLNIMEKSRKIRHLIEEVYRDVEKHRVDVEQPPKEEMKVLKDDERKFTQIFSHLAGERREERPLEKKEVLKQIEKVHTTLQETPVETESLKSLQEELEDLKSMVYKGEKRKVKK